MKHFIISRFNINHLLYVNHDLQKALSEVWFIERIDLFYRLTYPTICNQSTKEFYWLVLVDERTNQNLLNNFLSKDVFSLITLIKVGDTYLDKLKEVILELSDQDDDIITTTLDTDDGVFPDFIKTIQTIYKSSEETLPYGINLVNGLIVDCSSGILYCKSFYSNPFYSLVEKVESLVSVCKYPHHLLSSIIDTVNVFSGIYWIQNIHGRNFGNVIKGFPLMPENRYYSLIPVSYPSPSWKLYLIAIFKYGISKVKNGFIKLKNLVN